MKTTIFNIKLSEKDTSKIVKGILGYIFEKLEEDVNFEIREKDTEVYVNIILSSKEKQAQFIGKQGKVLATLQYLLNSILHRNFNDDRLFIIDIGGYKQKQIDYLKNLAIEAAIKAKKNWKRSNFTTNECNGKKNYSYITFTKCFCLHIFNW